MTIDQLEEALDANPNPAVASDFAAEIAHSLDYLASDEAARSLRSDVYWPKWDSPWWHMLVLHEMGLAKAIPKVASDAMVHALRQLPVKFFPIHTHEIEPGWDLHKDALCHCAVGSISSILRATEVDIDGELPWLRSWLSAYQMSDGGMSCDAEAYKAQESRAASSMVGLISIFEALLQTQSWTEDEQRFLDRAGSFLIHRELRLGSSSNHNAQEREEASLWLQPCFPRLYLYDVLRGLHAFLLWCQKRNRRVPLDVVAPAFEHLASLAPDGLMRNGRLSYQGVGSRVQQQDGTWQRRESASAFPLLAAVSRLGEISPFLTHQWAECKRLLRTLSIDPAPSAVTLVAPSENWPGLAQEEAQRFAAALGDNLVKVHHIGSTSIPGIWAKPLIDLAPEVRDIARVDSQRAAIESQGYECWGEYGLPGRRFCPRRGLDGARAANVHCYQTGDPELARHLAFRDYLTAFPKLAAEYEKVKLEARDRYPNDVYAYNDEKNPWIRRVEQDAVAWASANAV